MPLKKSATTSPMSRSVEKMIQAYKQTGKIGVVRPRDMAHARRIATAAAACVHGKRG